MRSAALDALDRLHGVAWHNDIESFYAPLSETLMWITALADATGKLEEPQYSGVAYARNCVLHGFVVVAAIHEQGPRSRSPLLGDVPRFTGRATVQIWGFTTDPEPHDPTAGKPERNKKRRGDYNTHVAGHSVFPMVDYLMWHLGVNIWAKQDDLAPRRLPRQATIVPGSMPPNPEAGEL
jgi:hypothetical protein